MRIQEPTYSNLVLCQLWPVAERRAFPVKGSLRRPVLLTILALTSVAFLSLMAVSAVQVTQTTSTLTITTTTTLPGTATITATIASTQYSNATNITTSTSTQGTQITTVYSTTTTLLSSATTIYTGTTTTSTTTTSRTAAIQIFANAWGELLVGSVGIAAIATAIASVVVPKILAAPRRGVVCGECGYRNPPFVKSYCTECGKPLRSAK